MRSRIRKRLDGPANSLILVVGVLLLGALLAYLTFVVFRGGPGVSPPADAAASGSATGDTALDGGPLQPDVPRSPAGCLVDTDCDQGQSCLAAACVTDPVEGTECRADHDCRVGQACRDGSCGPGPDSAL